MLVMNTNDHDCRCAPACIATESSPGGAEPTSLLMTPMPGLKCVKKSGLTGTKWSLEFCDEADLTEGKFGHGERSCSLPLVKQLHKTAITICSG